MCRKNLAANKERPHSTALGLKDKGNGKDLTYILKLRGYAVEKREPRSDTKGIRLGSCVFVVTFFNRVTSKTYIAGKLDGVGSRDDARVRRLDLRRARPCLNRHGDALRNSGVRYDGGTWAK